MTGIQSCPDLLAKPYTPLKYIIEQLIPAATMLLLHGDPRTKKSYTALELAIAAAAGKPAFGFSRFRCKPHRVLYLSQEDPEHVVRERIRGILEDKQLDPPPNLFMGIHLGISFDCAKGRQYLYDQTKAEKYDLTFIDPIRRFTAHADKGPSEVTPVTTFFRTMCVELGNTVGILHHNTKPMLFTNGTRKASYDASGGDWFASCECPIAFRSNGDKWTHVIPSDYKLDESPEPFEVSVYKDSAGRPHIQGRESVEDHRLDKIIDFLKASPKSSENTIASNCQIKRADVPLLCYEGEGKGLLTCELGKQNSHLWSVA